MRRVALIGNGLSIAACDGFRIPTLTAAMRAALEALDGGALVKRLDEVGAILAKGSPDFHPEQDFEDLLGPFDLVAALLRGPLGQIVGPGHQNVLQGAGLAVANIYIRGVGAVLGVIDDQPVENGPVQNVVDWMLTGFEDNDTLSVYTLNYDSLLDRWLLEAHNDEARPHVRLDDEFMPFQHALIPLAVNEQLEVFPLRTPNVPRPNNVHLYHLHGAMHWVEFAGAIWKARDIDDLRAHNVFARWAVGEVLPIVPHLVLTDQKAGKVEEEPFRSSYAAMRADLENADRVLVAGYGFGDAPLNAVLKHGWRRRKSTSRWLVVERGWPSWRLVRLRRVASVIAWAWPGRQLEVSRRGLPGVTIDKPVFWG